MNSRERAVNWIACNIDNADEDHRAGMLHTLTCLLDYHEEEAKAEQREECWHRSQHFLSQAGAWDCMQGVREACLNAIVEEGDPRVVSAG